MLTVDEQTVLSVCDEALTQVVPCVDRPRMHGVLWARLRAGRSAYGPLVLAEDRRDFRVEAEQEAADLMHYAAMLVVSATRAGIDPGPARRALEMAAQTWFLLGGEA